MELTEIINSETQVEDYSDTLHFLTTCTQLQAFTQNPVNLNEPREFLFPLSATFYTAALCATATHLHSASVDEWNSDAAKAHTV